MTADTLEKLEQKMRERANVLTEKGWLVAADLREFADTIAALRQQQGQESAFREGWEYGYARGQETPNAYSQPRKLDEDWREYVKELAFNAAAPEEG